MTQTYDLNSVAQQMKAAQDNAQYVPLWTAQAGFDLAASYEVMHLIHQARLAEGSVPVGRKIGFTNPAARAGVGATESMWAFIYNTTLIDLASGQAEVSIGRLVEPKIEPEIVLHFRVAPPVTDDLSAILACVDWVAHGFELVQSHFVGWKFQAPDTIADSGLHGLMLLGPRHEVGELGESPVTALEQFSVRLLCNGEERAAGTGANVLGNPLAAMAHLLDVVSRQGERARVQAGELVTTGSITAALPIKSGEIWSTEISGLPLAGLSIRFVD